MSVAVAERFVFACPVCGEGLEEEAGALRCPADGTGYTSDEGVWRFLPPERAAYFDRFLTEYEAVRRGEGRGSEDPEFHRGLPFVDLTGRFRWEWRIRATSYRALISRVVAPLESERGRPLRVLDLGAGNAWLSHRLAERGHAVAAVDLMTGSYDGLLAQVRFRNGRGYPGGGAVVAVQADFDTLPFAPAQFDLAVFNGSLHYSTGYARTLARALATLAPGGLLVIMDSPVYRDGSSGERMVRERESQFRRAYGFPSNAIPSENYLTVDGLEALARDLGVRWRTVSPFYGLRWAARSWKARLLGRREPARFLLLVGERGGS